MNPTKEMCEWWGNDLPSPNNTCESCSFRLLSNDSKVNKKR